MRFMKALALIAGLLIAPQAMAAYGGVTLGQDQTTPTATPVCVMYGTTCKAQIGTYNGSTGVWTLPSGFNLPGVGPLGAGVGPALGLATNANGGLATVSVSATAPSTPSLFQPWLNTTATPYVWNIWDGASWVALGTINATTHAIAFPTLNLAATPSGGFGGVSGILPATSFPAITGDCTTVAGALAITCTKTNGVAFTSAATTAIGTSGATIPLLNGINTWSALQTVANVYSNSFALKSVTYGSTSILGALVYDVAAQSTTTPEQSGVFRMTSSVNGGTGTAEYKMALGAETIMSGNTMAGWGQTVILSTSGSYPIGTHPAIAFEVDQNNTTLTHCGDGDVGVGYAPCGSLYITGAGNHQVSFGIGVSGNAQIRNGLTFFSGGPIATSIRDYSSSQVAWKDTGSHTNGLDGSGATYSGPFIVGPSSKFTVASTGAMVAYNATYTGIPATAGAAQISYGGNTSASTNCGSLAGSAGCVEINVAGTARHMPFY